MGKIFTAWNLGKSYWLSEEKWKAWGLLLTIIVLNLGMVYIDVWLNSWHATFYNVIEKYNQEGFFKALIQFSFVSICFLLIAGYAVYLQMMLQISWRQWMTKRYMSEWLDSQAYYQMDLLQDDYVTSLDNPDQRISEDINLFVRYTLSLSLGLLRSIVSLVSFVTILWQLSGVMEITFGQYTIPIVGYLVWAALGYSMLGTWLAIKIGWPLVRLEFNQQRYEADFRFSLMRLRENSESIAFYGGELREKTSFLERFQKVVNNYRKIMSLNKHLIWFTSGYSQVSIIFAILVASPRYFNNQINIGQMFQISNAYGQVHTALSFIIESFERIAEWRAVVNRLNQFYTSMEKVKRIKRERREFIINCKFREALLINHLDVLTPKGEILLKKLNLQIENGNSLLITGPSGCGKSTLLRTMAGIWPFCRGEIVLPGKERILFVPQKSYLPLGSLREILLYPESNQSMEDEVIKEKLIACKLAFLTDKLDQAEDWGKILSNGEQQRVAFIRIILQKPQWLFLDEATSALDEEMEEVMYTLIRETLPETTIISIGHRSTLTRYHNIKLEVNETGNWKISKITR